MFQRLHCTYDSICWLGTRWISCILAIGNGRGYRAVESWGSTGNGCIVGSGVVTFFSGIFLCWVVSLLGRHSHVVSYVVRFVHKSRCRRMAAMV